LDAQRLFKMRLCFVELPLRRQQRTEIDVRLRRARIQTYCLGEFLCCFIGSPRLLQLGSIIKMRPHTGWDISNDRGEALDLNLCGMHFREPKRCKRYNKDAYPFRAVQRPTWQKSICGNISGATADAERLSRGFLANFPDEAVVIKMEQCR